jgi:hypothetical protein
MWRARLVIGVALLAYGAEGDGRAAPPLDLQLHWDPQLLARIERPVPSRAPVPSSPERWVHPLGGPERALPRNSSRKFGARRPFHRPPECRAGHCGVDLGSHRGDPVFAIYDGVVERIERDENADPKSGRYVRIGHVSGKVVSRYIHLDSIREDLRRGDHVRGGEQIGRLGSTGIFNTGPHLHFALSVREGSKERYLDPEPFLRTWGLPDEPLVASAPPVDKPSVAPKAAPPPQMQWVPKQWVWFTDRWLWVPAGWRAPPAPDAPKPRFVARWVASHWSWDGRGWLWFPGGWWVQSPTAARPNG